MYALLGRRRIHALYTLSVPSAAMFFLGILISRVFGNVTNANAATLSAKQYLTKMERVMSKAKSVEMTQSTSVKMSMNGETVSLKATGNAIIFFNSGKAKYVQKVTAATAGQKETQTVRMYVKKSGEKLYMYTSSDGKLHRVSFR